MTDGETNTCCILAAGRGTRLGTLGELTHKGLLPLGNKAVITHILEAFGPRWNFVVALGDRAELVRDYVAIAHPEYSVQYVVVDPYSGPGSGPGYSLYSCAAELRRPFIFTACDTLITDPIPDARNDWISVVEVDRVEDWCSAVTDETGMVRELHYKTAAPTSLAFSGMAHVRHWREFWAGFEENHAVLGGEVQVNNGLEALIPFGLEARHLGWIDTGTMENYQDARRHFERNYSFDGKVTDLTYRIGERIIKYFPSEETARIRFARGATQPAAFVPVHERIGRYFSSSFVSGTLLSARLSARACSSFLEWAWTNLWKPVPVSANELRSVQRTFYLDKTRERLNGFLSRFAAAGEQPTIDIMGQPCAPVADLLASIDEQFYSNGIATGFHGDLHGDNILVSDAGYHLIDWRDTFGGQTRWGDVYYDLAKFYHTLELSVRTMERGEYRLTQSSSGVTLSHNLDFADHDAAWSFWQFVEDKGLDARRIRILNALVFINMAPLYDQTMAEYLYFLGRYNLQRALQ